MVLFEPIELFQIDMKMTSKTWLVIIHIKPLSKYHSHQGSDHVVLIVAI
jgi:hypothetical protein